MANNKQNHQTYLRDHGKTLLENGYNIHPVRPLKKVPDEYEWQNVRATPVHLKKWLANGHSHSGVSIILGNVLGIDIDVRDPQLAERMLQVVKDRLGVAPVRIGQAPKSMVFVRAAQEGIRKTKSAVMESWDGETHHVEILANGQQAVAYNIHPDTKAPYSYPSECLLDRSVDALPSCDLDDIDFIIDEFERLAAEEYDMEKKRNSERASLLSQDEQDDLFLENLGSRGKTDPEQMQETLSYLASKGYADDHDWWFKIGMALHYEFFGSDIGRDLWVGFSEQASSGIDVGGFERWESFGEDDYGGRPVTVGTVIHEAKKLKDEDRAEVLTEVEQLVSECEEPVALEKIVRDDVSRMHTELSTVGRARVETLLRKRFKDLGVNIGARDLRKLLKPVVNKSKVVEPGSRLTSRFPVFEGWVWSDQADEFAHPSHGSLSRTSFRIHFEKHLIRIPENEAEVLVPQERFVANFYDPVWFVANVLECETVSDTAYIPDPDWAGKIVIDPETDRRFLNTYRPWVGEGGFPIAAPEEWTKRQQQAVARFKRLILSVCGGEKRSFEADILTSWIASRWQNPIRKHQYAIFMHGPKGSGKTTVYDYLLKVFGGQAVKAISPAEVESPFNAYSGAAVFGFVDEIDLSNRKDRERIATTLRTDITGRRVVRIRKGSDGVNVDNYQDMLFASNSADGIPIDEGERRFLVLASEFDSRESARAFMVESGFRDLIEQDLNDDDCLAALRGYLDGFVINSEFNPCDPPETDAKRASTKAGRSALAQEIEDIVGSGDYWWASPEFICVTHLRDELVRRVETKRAPDLDPRMNRNVLGKVLADAPFNFIDDGRVGAGGEKFSFRYRPSLIEQDSVKNLIQEGVAQEKDDTWD